MLQQRKAFRETKFQKIDTDVQKLFNMLYLFFQTHSGVLWFARYALEYTFKENYKCVQERIYD